MEELIMQSLQSVALTNQRSSLDTWNNVLKALVQALQPSSEDQAKRQRVLTDVGNVLLQVRQSCSCNLMPYGSFESGLYFPDSDLDMAIMGASQAMGAVSELHHLPIPSQVRLLHEVARLLDDHKLVHGKVERVLGARVPVLNFKHSPTLVDCDIIMGKPESAFKARFLRCLSEIDARFPQLYRLIKLWALNHDINCAQFSTFNSWTLCMLVVFYLQAQGPPILPPLWQLCGHAAAPPLYQPRVLQQNDVRLDSVINKARLGAGIFVQRRDQQGTRNDKLLVELLTGFFAFYSEPLNAWSEGKYQGWRVSTWYGKWIQQEFRKDYIFPVEDPFDNTDNTARSVGTYTASNGTADYIAWVFGRTHEVVQKYLVRCGGRLDKLRAAYCWLFGPAGVVKLSAQNAYSIGFDAELLQHLQTAASAAAGRPPNPAKEVLRKLLRSPCVGAGELARVVSMQDYKVQARRKEKAAAQQAMQQQYHQQQQQQQQDTPVATKRLARQSSTPSTSQVSTPLQETAPHATTGIPRQPATSSAGQIDVQQQGQQNSRQQQQQLQPPGGVSQQRRQQTTPRQESSTEVTNQAASSSSKQSNGPERGGIHNNTAPPPPAPPARPPSKQQQTRQQPKSQQQQQPEQQQKSTQPQQQSQSQQPPRQRQRNRQGSAKDGSNSLQQQQRQQTLDEQHISSTDTVSQDNKYSSSSSNSQVSHKPSQPMSATQAQRGIHSMQQWQQRPPPPPPPPPPQSQQQPALSVKQSSTEQQQKQHNQPQLAQV
eukprot:jgi/Chrzof1/12362/Cz06g31260.t1